MEEYLAAKIWPVTFSWRARSFAKVKFGSMSNSIPCPKLGLKKPAGMSDEIVVAELEREGIAMLGPYTSKEHKSFLWSAAPTELVLIEVYMRWE